MLTEEEKIRIKEEEIFRHEVQQQLRPNDVTTKRAKLWGALNTPFVLWLLSSFLLGLFGWAYSSFQSRNKQIQERAELARKLDEELQFRVDTALSALEGMKKEVEQGYKVYSPSSIYSIVLKKLDGVGEERNVMYPEFRERGLQSLISQMFYADPSFFEPRGYDSRAYDEIKSHSYGPVFEKSGSTSEEDRQSCLRTIDEARTIVVRISPWQNFGSN
jgi:hypothetical protein